MPEPSLLEHIIRTLLYYEIFDHPLSADELFALLPKNSITRSSFISILEASVLGGALVESHGLYTRPQYAGTARIRLQREQLARHRFRVARFMAQIIKRFPFVRAVFISGDLSKGVASPSSDIDYVIVTKPGRLWICRMILVLFKKIVLLNQRKYFCLNYFIDENHLTLVEHDYYVATEVAHLKPLYNMELYLEFINANSWIKSYFPNYRAFSMRPTGVSNRRSMMQKLFEFPFTGAWADVLDRRMMEVMKNTWRRRYPEYDDDTREKLFLCTLSESRAYVGNFSEKILSQYNEKLEQYYAR